MENQCLILEASPIEYDLAREDGRVMRFFDEVLSGLAREIPKEERRPGLSPYKSWSEEERVLRHTWSHGLDHIILVIHPESATLILDIIWHAPFESEFVLGCVQDFYRPAAADIHMHVFPLHAKVARRAPRPSARA